MGKPNDAEITALMDVDAPTSEMLGWDNARLASLTHSYYADADTFYLRETPVQPADNWYVDRYAVLRLHPETNEVLGAHVESWEKFFLPLHPEFREAWEGVVKPHLASERQASPDELARFNLALMRRILDALRESERAAAKDAKARV